MADRRMTNEDLEKYEEVVPVANNILVEVLEKQTEKTLLSGIVVTEEDVTGARPRPYFQVLAISPQVAPKTNFEVGDLVEVLGGQVSFIYGKDLQKLALLNVGQVAGVHKKKKA